VATFAARELDEALRDLLNDLDQLIGEMRQEKNFTVESVVTHLQSAVEFHHRIALTHGLHFAKECLALPQLANARGFLQAADILLEDVAIPKLIATLSEAPLGIPWGDAHPTYAPVIKKVLKEDVPAILEAIRYKDKQEYRRAAEQDRKRMHEDDFCRPRLRQHSLGKDSLGA
jgi:hypothetical protein